METITPRKMRSIDENAVYLGLSAKTLMENAGRNTAEAIRKHYDDLTDKKVIVIAGIGNNGGDGFVAARHLAGYGVDVHVILLGRPEHVITNEAKTNLSILKKMTFTIKFTSITDPSMLVSLEKEILNADVIVDGILGTGIRGDVREPATSIINLINASHAFKVAIDIPSGLDPITGEPHGKAVKADVTVTFHRAKAGLIIGREYTGEIIVASIGIPPEAEILVGPGDVRAVLKPRTPYSHKGDFGRILVVGGSIDFSGAPALAAVSALRTGADLAIVASPKSVAETIRGFSPNLIVRELSQDYLMPSDLPRLMRLLDYATSVVVGPGLGLEEGTKEACLEFMAEAGRRDVPMVVDADALKALSTKPRLLSGRPAVLTPHAGEFGAVTGNVLSPPEDLESRVEQVKAAAEELGVVILLKSHEDIVSDGKSYRMNRTGNPGMTVGGTGDVLSGIVATLLGWNATPYEAAVAGVFISGCAGDLAVEEKGYHIMATDVIEKIPLVFKKLSFK